MDKTSDSMAGDHWFKPKTYGYGATPSNWKGWAATLTYAAVIVGLGLTLVGRPLGGNGPDAARIVTWLVMVAAITSAFLLFTKSKTDGEWKWRWGTRT